MLHASGIHHVALWARSKKEVDEFYQEFLLKNRIEVTDPPADYPVYSPGYCSVFFNDPLTGIHFELAYTAVFPWIGTTLSWIRELKQVWKAHPEWKSLP